MKEKGEDKVKDKRKEGEKCQRKRGGERQRLREIKKEKESEREKQRESFWCVFSLKTTFIFISLFDCINDELRNCFAKHHSDKSMVGESSPIYS